MSIYAFLPAVTAFFILLIGCFVYLQNIKSKINAFFALFCLSMFVWLCGFVNMYLTSDPVTALSWARFGFMGIYFIPILAYHFILIFIGRPINKLFLSALYFLAIPTLFLVRTKHIYAGVNKHFWGFYPYAGAFYFIYLLMFFLLFTYGVVLLFFAQQEEKAEKNFLKSQQIKYVLIAFAGGTLGVVDYIVKYGVDVYPFGYICAFFFISIIAYAIVTTHLMDIEVVIKRSIVYAILTAVLASFYFAAVYLSEAVFQRLTGYSSFWLFIPAVIVLAMIFQPLHYRIQHWVDITFFKSRYDYQQILSRYAKALRRPTTNLERFLKVAPYLVTKAMKLSGAGVLVLNRAHNRYELRAGQGIYKGNFHKTISSERKIIKTIASTGQTLGMNEIAQKDNTGELKTEMAELKASLLIPSISESEYFKDPTLIVIFVFGQKLSEDPFSREDIAFLETMARQAAITIEYAFILEELKRDEQQIIQSEKFAALGTMAGSVVGALKTPIENMENYSRTMTKKFNDPAFREGFIKDIPQSITRLDRVVNDLLIYARPMKLKCSSVKLNEVVEKAIDLLKIKEMKEHVEVKKGLSELPEIQADPQHILNAILRLVSYSVAAAPKQLWIATGYEGRMVYFSVAIPGSVIPEKDLDKIFVSYYSPKEGEGGLELATAAKIFREHGGDLTVESNEVKGTKFVASLPIQ